MVKTNEAKKAANKKINYGSAEQIISYLNPQKSSFKFEKCARAQILDYQIKRLNI